MALRKNFNSKSHGKGYERNKREKKRNKRRPSRRWGILSTWKKRWPETQWSKSFGLPKKDDLKHNEAGSLDTIPHWTLIWARIWGNILMSEVICLSCCHPVFRLRRSFAAAALLQWPCPQHYPDSSTRQEKILRGAANRQQPVTCWINKTSNNYFVSESATEIRSMHMQVS